MSDELLTLPPDVRLMNSLSLLLAAVFALMVLALAAQWLLQRPLFGLRAIQVDNEIGRNNAVTLRANVAPKLAGNFFTLDLAQAKVETVDRDGTKSLGVLPLLAEEVELDPDCSE